MNSVHVSAENKPCCQNHKQGSKKKLGDELRIFIKKNENFFFKKIPDRCRWVFLYHSVCLSGVIFSECLIIFHSLHDQWQIEFIVMISGNLSDYYSCSVQ